MSVPVYLYIGPEFGERNDAVNQLKKDLQKKFGSIDDYLYYASDTSCATVVSMLQSESLFQDATCVVYKAAELIKKKEDIELLSSWIKSVTPDSKNKNPKESAVLILVSDETAVDSKLSKIIPKENQKVFWVMFENRRVPWLRDFFKKNGYSLEEEAAQLILELIENNTESLKTECSRFFTLFPQGTSIDVDMVDKVLTDTREESAFTLFGAMTDNTQSPQKRLESSLSILQKIRLSKDSSSKSPAIIAGLAFCFRKLITYHELSQNGQTDEFSLKKAGFTSLTARKQYASASRLWTQGQTAAVLSQLADTDMNIRNTGSSVESACLELMLYSIILKKGASLQSYQEIF